jgi:hypothetical protein
MNAQQICKQTSSTEIIKKMQWKNWNLCTLLVGTQNVAINVLKSSTMVPQKIKNRVTTCSCNPTSG